jgi:hypothetical protein
MAEAEHSLHDQVQETVLPNPPGENRCSLADELVLESKPAKP